jgi:hypothetical protein
MAGTLVSAGSVVLALALLVLLLRGLPEPRQAGGGGRVAGDGPAAGGTGTQVAARAALAFTLAWLFAWPYVLPWYDAMAWALLPLVAWSWADWLMLGRTAALAFGYLPAIANPARPLPADLGWLQSVVRTGVTPAILAALTVALVVACVAGSRGRGAESRDREELPALPVERPTGS